MTLPSQRILHRRPGTLLRIHGERVEVRAEPNWAAAHIGSIVREVNAEQDNAIAPACPRCHYHHANGTCLEVRTVPRGVSGVDDLRETLKHGNAAQRERAVELARARDRRLAKELRRNRSSARSRAATARIARVLKGAASA